MMKEWFKLVVKSIKIFLLFTGCTVLFYYGIMFVNEEYQNYHRYDEPQGSALKVSGPVEGEGLPWLERLFLFYLNGE